MIDNMDDVRKELADTHARLKAGTITVAQARAEGELLGRITDLAKVEIVARELAHKRGDNVPASRFLPEADMNEVGNGIVRILQHRIKP